MSFKTMDDGQVLIYAVSVKVATPYQIENFVFFGVLNGSDFR